MEKEVYREIEEKVEKIENEYGSIENFVNCTTLSNDKHRMRMEEYLFSDLKELEQIYKELDDLEFADLTDYNKMEGLFDGDFS